MDRFFLVFELLGTMAFAASGALVGIRRRMDVFGVCTLGLTTAVGGGMLRDVLLGNTPPIAFRSSAASAVAVTVSLCLFLPGIRHRLTDNHRRSDLVSLLLDSAGLGIFTVTGVRTAWESVAAPSLYLTVFVGVITGVGGGVLRDLFAGETPYILRKHVYACASLLGALVCALLRIPAGERAAMLWGAGTVFLLRLLSAHYHWNLPQPRE